MIHVTKEKHLNDFKEVRCVRPRDLFARFGKRESPISFDSNLEEQVPMNMSKLDSIEYLEMYDEQQSSLQAGTDAESNGKQSFQDTTNDV